MLAPRAADAGAHPCDLCVKRDRAEGGNGNCPLRRNSASWAEHKVTWPDGCASWKPGDLKSRSRPHTLLTESLF